MSKLNKLVKKIKQKYVQKIKDNIQNKNELLTKVTLQRLFGGERCHYVDFVKENFDEK